MPKERSERRMYRRSPGRQYGYSYDPLKSQIGQNRQHPLEPASLSSQSSISDIPTRSGALSTQRPSLRRTRQLTRKSILESRRAALAEADQQLESQEDEVSQHGYSYEGPEDSTLYSSRRAARNAYQEQIHQPSTHQLLPEEDEAYQEDYADEDQDEYDEEPGDEWADVDPDMGYDAGYDEGYEEPDPMDARMARMGYRDREVAPRAERDSARRTRELDESREYERYYDEDDEEEIRSPREEARARRKARKVTRRRVLFGLGAAAVGGAGVAAYELVPKIPQALEGAATNVEQQIQEAFNKGLAQGADNARRELIGTLENLEGFTLDSAIGAAKLTRIAYDVFVSPIITQSANITGNILNAMLQAVKTARGVLAQSFLDNPTLQAIQKVLQSWVDQVSNMPKQLNSITDTDLDGAQAYLNALKQKIADEKAQLNKSSSATPTPTSTNKSK